MPSDTDPSGELSEEATSVLKDGILVLVSVVLAVWLGWHYFGERSVIVGMLDKLGNESIVKEEGWHTKAWAHLSDEKQFQLFGDLTRKTRSAQERALWEKNPESKVYYANYVRVLLEDYKEKDLGISFDYLKKEIRRGEELDPDNAFYNYMLAAVLFKRGAEWKSIKGKKAKEWTIKDKALLDLAIVELNMAAKKPYYRRYLSDFLKERLALFPETKRLEDRVFKMTYFASIPLADLGLIRDLFKMLPFYVERNELPEDDATELLDAWQEFLEKAIPDAWCLIDVLVFSAIANMAGGEVDDSMAEGKRDESVAFGKVADVYEAMGKPEDANSTRLLAKKIGEPKKNWDAVRESKKVEEMERDLIFWKGSILARMLLPVLGEPVTEEMLRPGRQADRSVIEQFYLSYILCIFVVAIIGTLILFKVCLSASKGRTPSLFLLPPWRVVLKNLGLAILLPMFLYFAFTRWSGISSFENGIEDWRLLFLELGLLGVSFLAASTLLSASYIRKRCQVLDVPTPKPANSHLIKLCWGGMGILCLCCAASKQIFGHQGAFETGLYLFGTGMGLIICGVGIVVFIKGCMSRNTYGLYYGTLARSLMPVYACAIILIAVIGLPWLQKEESALLNKDPLFDSNPHGFTVLEGNLTKRLQSELAAAMKAAKKR
ncbi:MAG: hypothetical protein CL509_10010 [Actinobacteria bacterium]|nr:hypothetical protein [Actinomycetota bacterium]